LLEGFLKKTLYENQPTNGKRTSMLKKISGLKTARATQGESSWPTDCLSTVGTLGSSPIRV